ncbi:conserved hypothetical protein [Talaromyces stipitatus ATCC 10500]|uniref:Uncharacterized protein n=1 Tax=Talaromyces stipitatus (strain ATCC 10500 / CBS 375.48 / QM 6759 / NRRL 1006) TaxID=441959 RepID=B8M4A1_TALSN|nr:uncharacterized protein TSTA_024250 [Talaromyces stipitatus ATCC 10500]EED19096.1 conserved hypothetical protein [Talaromyces stipitatus ATCC 10500]
MSPIFLGEDFGALLSVSSIRSQKDLWIDLWRHFDPGEKVVPVDGQYLTSLNSFGGLRRLRVTGMLKSYQKQLFQAIWKMEQLEDLQLRMAEEPRVSSQLPWRLIEEGWVPNAEGTHAGLSPGDGKGRIKRQYGNAEYFDNCVIELAKPKLNPDYPEYEAWMSRLLPIVHLTLRGFVVDAIPFCSCFDGQKLRSITFTDCIDAGFCLPYEMNNVQLRVDCSKTARAEPIRQVVPDRELKRITLKEGRKIDESPASSPTQSVSSRSRYHRKPDPSTSIPHRVPLPSPAPAPSSPSSPFPSLMPSGQCLRQPRFSMHFHRRVVSSVIEEDEGEE